MKNDFKIGDILISKGGAFISYFIYNGRKINNCYGAIVYLQVFENDYMHGLNSKMFTDNKNVRPATVEEELYFLHRLQKLGISYNKDAKIAIKIN